MSESPAGEEFDAESWFDFEDIPLGVDYQNRLMTASTKPTTFCSSSRPTRSTPPIAAWKLSWPCSATSGSFRCCMWSRSVGRPGKQRIPTAPTRNGPSINLREAFQLPQHAPSDQQDQLGVFPRRADDYEQSFQGLLELLNRQKDYVHQHTVLLNQALDWERNQKRTRYLLIGEDRQQAETWLAKRFQGRTGPCMPTDLHCEYITESIKNANNLMTQVFLCHAEKPIEDCRTGQTQP
jgi:hypothetical protein